MVNWPARRVLLWVSATAWLNLARPRISSIMSPAMVHCGDTEVPLFNTQCHLFAGGLFCSSPEGFVASYFPRDDCPGIGVAPSNHTGMGRFAGVTFLNFHPAVRVRVAEPAGWMDEWTKPIIRTQSAAKIMHTLNHSHTHSHKYTAVKSWDDFNTLSKNTWALHSPLPHTSSEADNCVHQPTFAFTCL